MSSPKFFRVEQNDHALIISAVANTHGLVEDEVRDECDSLLEQLAKHESKHAIIDLEALDYFGSIMLELMVVVWKSVNKSGGKFAVCRVSKVGQEILKTARFDTIWPILKTKEEAIANVNS
jgi:anti-anti-sigma factor